MIRIQAGRTGYSGYDCVGVEPLDEAYRAFDLSCEAPDDYLKLPTAFKGFVIWVDDIEDCSEVEGGAEEQCAVDMNPFSGLFLDLFQVVGAGSEEIGKCFPTSEELCGPALMEPMLSTGSQAVEIDINTSMDAALDGAFMSLALLTAWRKLVDIALIKIKNWLAYLELLIAGSSYPLLFPTPCEDEDTEEYHFILDVHDNENYTHSIFYIDTASTRKNVTANDGSKWVDYPSTGIDDAFYCNVVSVLSPGRMHTGKYWLRYKFYPVGTNPSLMEWKYSQYPSITPATAPGKGGVGVGIVELGQLKTITPVGAGYATYQKVSIGEDGTVTPVGAVLPCVIPKLYHYTKGE